MCVKKKSWHGHLKWRTDFFIGAGAKNIFAVIIAVRNQNKFLNIISPFLGPVTFSCVDLSCSD
jgi:hypothetical protein